MKILLADDHSIVRKGLYKIVQDAFAEAIIGETSSAEELLIKVKNDEWTILILDIALGDKNSLEMIPELIKIRPSLKIIILSMYNERQFAMRAIHHGVLGYVTKDRAPEELLLAIRNVLQGKRYICESVALQIVEYASLSKSTTQIPHETLSSREYEVFLDLASALSVSEIADKMDLSIKTISTYRSRILEKLNLTSNAQLIRYALEHKLLK